MTPEQMTLVQTSWEKVVPISDKAAELFYGKLFETDPELKPLFKGDMAEQGKKLMTMITTVVRGMKNLEALVPAIQDLGRRHVGYGVKDEHYDTVGSFIDLDLGTGLWEKTSPRKQERRG